MGIFNDSTLIMQRIGSLSSKQKGLSAIGLLGVVVIIAYVILPAAITPEILENLIEILTGFGYLGALLAGFVGSSSVFVAVFPSFLVIPILASQLNPLFVGILGGIGAGVGQYLHYYIGLGGRRIISLKLQSRMDAWRVRLDKYGVVVILLFAVTPLTPDDLLWIPLGLMRYPKAKALAAAIAGKIILNLMYAYAGVFSFDYFFDYFMA